MIRPADSPVFISWVGTIHQSDGFIFGRPKYNGGNANDDREINSMATDLMTEEATTADEIDTDFVASNGGGAILHDISWKMYRRLRKMRANCNIRMTYDRGELEIMSPSPMHEWIATLVGRLIDIWTVEQNIPIRSCGKMTIKRAVLKRGFEPDNCYYVQNEPLMWNKNKIDFKVDPAPDLAIEVEITRKILNKTSIYAAFRVPELWVCPGQNIQVRELTKDGEYVPRDSSICLPGFPLDKAREVVRQVGLEHETTLIRSFRDWVRENVSSK